ncbi:Nipped-B-like protein B [Symbiodinium microadriaticum]|uniref:Nipped-B-like protein B n=1 Tax=Symbiodinium microadriaticum TaxID=2951 RepID=A0A1Q9C7B9_SYMMI|nr:Nipped-B-like protein B [Symbiodinium microadriaticum]
MRRVCYGEYLAVMVKAAEVVYNEPPKFVEGTKLFLDRMFAKHVWEYQDGDMDLPRWIEALSEMSFCLKLYGDGLYLTDCQLFEMQPSQLVDREKDQDQLVDREKDQDQLVDREKDQDQLVDREQDQDQDQLVDREKDQDQLVDREQDQDQDQLVDREKDQDQLVDREKDQDQEQHFQPAPAGEIFDNLDFGYLLDHARHIHKLSETDKEKLHNEHHKTQRHLLPDLGNKGLKMLLILVCPHFVAEKSISKDAKCGRHLEAMMIEILDDAFCK